MDSDALSGAAKLYESAYSDARTAVERRTGALDANWGCAETDSAGKTWPDGHGPPAVQAVAVGTAIVNAFGKLHDLLTVTGVYHSNIGWSTAGG